MAGWVGVSALLARIGAAAAQHPWRVITAWLAALAMAVALAAALGSGTHDVYEIPGAPSQRGFDLIAARFPAFSGTDARVVVHDRGGGRLPSSDLAAAARRLAAIPGVSAVPPARISASGSTALFTVQYSVPVTEFSGSAGVDALRSATAPLQRQGLEVELGGQVAENFTSPGGSAEAFGVLAALLILILAFGNLLAAGLPVAVALVGLGIGMSAVRLLSAVTSVSSTAPTIATMVGIGVGVDYALLLLTRYAEGLRQGLTVPQAAGRANATAGESVVFAGTTVLAGLLGLRLAGLPIYASYGYATLLVVLAVMVTSVTLVPALCGLAGLRVLGRRARARVRAGARAGGLRAITPTHRWATRVAARPLPWALGALALMLTLAAPALGMRTWPQDAGSQPESNTTRRAYDLVAAEFGPGADGPLLLVVDLRRVGQGRLAGVLDGVRAEPGVRAVGAPVTDPAGDLAVAAVEPTTGPQDAATGQLIARLRTRLPAGVEVAGLTAAFADVAQVLDHRLAVVVGFVVALALLLLTVVFRAPVVALKAAVMNLLSVAAAYGVMVVLFQWGWGVRLLGVPHPVPVSSCVPILMFAVLFGLSMDYEVFLLSRVREHWLHGAGGRGSVVEGLAGTGRVITSAAAIMVAVFAAFALDADVVVKMTGVGMATAVFLDASVVRMVLVPATMALLGRVNWWLPGWLDRALPHLDRPLPRPDRPLPPAQRPLPHPGAARSEPERAGADSADRLVRHRTARAPRPVPVSDLAPGPNPRRR